jgi:hypothetical protein
VVLLLQQRHLYPALKTTITTMKQSAKQWNRATSSPHLHARTIRLVRTSHHVRIIAAVVVVIEVATGVEIVAVIVAEARVAVRAVAAIVMIVVAAVEAVTGAALSVAAVTGVIVADKAAVVVIVVVAEAAMRVDIISHHHGLIITNVDIRLRDGVTLHLLSAMC